MLKSLNFDQIYVGSTKDLRKRLIEHNYGKEKSSRRYIPWKLVYYEAFEFEKYARIREKRLKYHGNSMNELKKRIGLVSEGEILKTIKSGAGFSLIELLVGIAIVLTASTIVLSIIITSFRISNKTTTVDSLRQNGNYAISQLTRMIQFAESFEGLRDAPAQTNFSSMCQTDDEYNTLRITYQKITREISCTPTAGGGGLKMNNASMIDESINVESCKLTCRRDDLDSAPVIGIELKLNKGGSDSSVEQSAAIDFNTKIKMRNSF